MSALACAPGPWSMLNNTCAMPSVAQEDAAQHVRWQLGWSTSQVRMVRILVSICFNLFQPTFVRWTNWYFDFQKHDKEARRSKFSLWNPLESFGILCRSWQDIGVQHHGRCGSSLGFEIDRRAVSFIRFISMISMRSMMIYDDLCYDCARYKPFISTHIRVLNKSSPYQ